MRKAIVEAIWEAQGRACFVCDRFLRLEAAERSSVVPGARGMANVLMAHPACARRRSERAPTARELARIGTTLKALPGPIRRQLMASSMNALKEAQSAAERARMVVMVAVRYAPTAEAAEALQTLAGPGPELP